MITPAVSPAALLCEIVAPSRARAADLAAIARVCARDLRQTIRVRRQPPVAGTESLIVLHLPAALAAAQHPIWCLACRLACFCPDVRVSVQVSCHGAFDRRSRDFRASASNAA